MEFYLMERNGEYLAYNTPDRSDDVLREWGWRDIGVISRDEIPANAVVERNDGEALSFSWWEAG